MDARCVSLLREEGADRQFGVTIPTDATIALLVTLELPDQTTSAGAFEEIGRFRDLDSALARFCRTLDAAGVLDHVEIAVPGDAARASQLLALREAVPAAVNARVGRAKTSIDRRIQKTAADMIVPFDPLRDLMQLYDEEFARRGLDAAILGPHLGWQPSPQRDPALDRGCRSRANRRFACLGARSSASADRPLAEHGVGRNPVKQALLRELYGDEGIREMRAAGRKALTLTTSLQLV